MAGLLIAVVCVAAAHAEFQPHRIYKERSKTSLDFGWKFFQGDPSGTPWDSGYNDAGWSTVNIPHSASYDPPTFQGESNSFRGVCWYRKTFTVPPQAKHTGKIFIEFEGAMQGADVWLNGGKIGAHRNSGYTWFGFDVTDSVSLTGVNVLVVRLDNEYRWDIPPGNDGSLGIYPDYFIYSGLYRDVWLVCTDKCHMPLYSQRISIPAASASASAAQVNILTTVRNDDATAKNVSLSYVITDSNNARVLVTGPVTEPAATIQPGDSFAFRTVCGPLIGPRLWSPDNPYLYKLYTCIKVDGQPVDDYVDRFGVRWYTWTPGEGFALNDSVTIIRGASLHQAIGWIQNALPNSRHYREVSLVKEMGANLIRCAHFPRDPAFYDACDELGMMLMVEVPTWGYARYSYPDTFWIRLNNCMKEMIEVGYNHPSIIAWGLFNEPAASFNTANQIPLMSATAHAMDSTRYNYIADNRLNDPVLVRQTDIVGMNYVELNGPCENMVTRILNTEYHQGWLYWCFRGGSNDNESPYGYAMQRWNLWVDLLYAKRVNKIAGAVMWCFNDYWSGWMQHPMGVVDHYRIPKAVYYRFRKYWTPTHIPSETPVPDLTVTDLRLDSDMGSLTADSTDVAIITASFRDSNGVCVDTRSGPDDSIPVTFTVNGPADYFGPATVKAFAGKCALIIKSRNTPGAITVSASATVPATMLSLASDPVIINAVPADTSSLPFIYASVLERPQTTAFRNVLVRQARNSLIVRFPSLAETAFGIVLVNARGQSMTCPVRTAGTTLTIDTRRLATGYYFLAIGKNGTGGNLTKKVFIAR
ncbi:MAG: beta galactosidase jelly roll domain-containing protein [Chitinispirillaceae bacterium]|nr:beta galactosidase jelly roll domain-containing protein [Chitinispirillaceae bacterium]